jgi:hypothetical protein
MFDAEPKLPMFAVDVADERPRQTLPSHRELFREWLSEPEELEFLDHEAATEDEGPTAPAASPPHAAQSRAAKRRM